ncbi:hypothetical protein [Arthrobacter sp. HY1533]|uniref:hypothetical protein n=1 Tax=Arthrobacter sp. HY1533 TaxID=2970919 RepID=UPI0022BA0714|nr:hypothetical protein [Arthrobacter sp. HY1533]
MTAALGLMTGCAGSPAQVAPSSTSVLEDTADGCLRTDGGCLGVLSPGAHKSVHFTTFGEPSAGQFSYTVDSSWANALDHTPSYWFQRADAYAASNGDAQLPGVYVWGDVAAAAQTFPSCPEESDPAGPTEAVDLLAWMTTLRGVIATPISARIGGATVDGLDIRVDPATSLTCDGAGPYALLIAGRQGAPDPYLWGVSSVERAQVFLLDLGGGHTAAVFIQAPTAEFDALLPPAQDLIATFKFTAP